jgi:hypothetical protein
MLESLARPSWPLLPLAELAREDLAGVCGAVEHDGAFPLESGGPHGRGGSVVNFGLFRSLIYRAEVVPILRPRDTQSSPTSETSEWVLR